MIHAAGAQCCPLWWSNQDHLLSLKLAYGDKNLPPNVTSGCGGLHTVMESVY